MRVLNEFNITENQEDIKDLIITDLVAKIGWIKGNYPNKKDSDTNLDLLYRHLSFENYKESIESYFWDNNTEIYSRIVKKLPISWHFFGDNFPFIKWYCDDDTIYYTLVWS